MSAWATKVFLNTDKEQIETYEIKYLNGILQGDLLSLIPFYFKREPIVVLKATFHLTISMRGQRATGKIQRNNYHHLSCGPSLTGKTMSVFLIFTQETHQNVKNR